MVRYKILRIKIAITSVVMAISLFVLAQTRNQLVWDKLADDAVNLKTAKEKLASAQHLLDSFYQWRLPKDSVYVRLLDRIGLYYYLSSNDLENAIAYASLAVESGRILKKQNSAIVNSAAYRNLAYYFKFSKRYRDALNYFDSTIMISKKLVGKEDVILDSRKMRCVILFELGDYAIITEESSRALFESRHFSLPSYFPVFYNFRSQANNYQNELTTASVDADSALNNAINLGDTFEMATAIKTMAIIKYKRRDFSNADSLFNRAIFLRSKTTNLGQVADDYIDYGNFLADSIHNYKDAIKSHYKVEKIATFLNDSSLLAKAYTNIGVAFFKSKNYREAFKFYRKALTCLGVKTLTNDLINLSAASLNKVSNKDLLTVLLGDYTEVLLHLYRVNPDKNLINASLRVALVTDSVISFLRHEQLGEQSKLFWRNKTREFYTNAIEACYLSRDIQHAFYFMEKSRAVLLNDRLNELGAGNQLPPDVSQKEQQLQANVVRQQQNLNGINESSTAYQEQMNRLLNAKDSLERFARLLELKYPIYYQYKYSNAVPSLGALQVFLKDHKQHLLEYFVTDTTIYCLSISHDKTKFVRISSGLISLQDFQKLMELNSNINLLNQQYQEYISVSVKAYNALFGNMDIGTDRIIVCPDEIFFPVEALCINASGKQFLLQLYSVSYTYSANFLLRNYFVNKSGNNFLGYAPGTFPSNNQLPSLPASVEALNTAGSYFSNATIFKGKRANKFNFISNLPNYSIVNLYSHAIADSKGSGPAIYMYDSLIRLSELGLIRNYSTQLIILSACETNAGKNFTGEGIYSMARGFSSIGIPSVAATLWKADETAIYEITSFFNEQLSKGMNKDEALRLAKLHYIKNHNGAGQLPFYWANLILIGDASPVTLTGGSSFNKLVAIILSIIVILTIAVFVRKSRIFKKGRDIKLSRYKINFF